MPDTLFVRSFSSVARQCSGRCSAILRGYSKVFSQFLEDYAERCIQLAYQCQNKNAERFLRLLAVDLMLAARTQQPQPVKDLAPNSNVSDELAELGRLATAAVKPESASRA